MKLAWFSPISPIRSGIAHYSAELVPELKTKHSIDIFVDDHPTQQLNDARNTFSAHEFIWKHKNNPYDLMVYQLGNSPFHDYMWPYLIRYSGLVVLHDGHLHHSRGRCLLQAKRRDHYKSEFCFNHPGTNPNITELGISGLLGTLTFLWPMRRIVTEASRLVVLHDAWLANEIKDESPQAQVMTIPMGVSKCVSSSNAREKVNSRHNIPSDVILFAAFGKLTPEKRIPQILRAIQLVNTKSVPVHILLCGETVDHYSALADAESLGIRHLVTITNYVENSAMPDYISASDVCLCLRWPSSRETSSSWLRCLSAGRPTIITDLVQLANIPAYDPRNWTISGQSKTTDSLRRNVDPACVTIDILDEDHSLVLAIEKLATSEDMRNSLGINAKKLWKSQFTLKKMVSGYEQAINAAASNPDPRPTLPSHLLSDGTELMQTLLSEMRFPTEHFKNLMMPFTGENKNHS
jgi:glycosyltransferase involved in cell wall biosynthesis